MCVTYPTDLLPVHPEGWRTGNRPGREWLWPARPGGVELWVGSGGWTPSKNEVGWSLAPFEGPRRSPPMMEVGVSVRTGATYGQPGRHRLPPSCPTLHATAVCPVLEHT